MCLSVEKKNQQTLSFLKVIPAGLGLGTWGVGCGCTELPLLHHLWSSHSGPFPQDQFSLLQSPGTRQAGCSIERHLQF